MTGAPHAAVVAAPMRLEARALTAGGVPPALVARTGVGAARSRRAASQRLGAASAVAVAGIAGALDPRLEAGDVVVADEVRADDGSVVARFPAARLVAARIRATGARCWVGPVVTSRHLASGRGRARLGGAGALAVDLESRWLVDPDRPGLVVRVVADVADRALWAPATAARVQRALRALERVAPVLTDWSRAVGPRTVLLAGPRSFCAGVERAIDVVRLALDQHGPPVYVRKQIVHNQHVVAELRERGAVFVEDVSEVPSSSTVVFSAHGVAPDVWQAARERGLRIIDATCPLVAKVHTEVRRFSDQGDTVLFIGHAGHEETEGTMGERPGTTVLVEDVADARTVQVRDPDRVSYLVQTTLAVQEVDEIVAVLRRRFPRLRAPAKDDICYATTNRQRAVVEVSAGSELVLVVGSQNSSNSQRLVETALRSGAAAHLVDGVDDVDLSWLAGVRTVGLTAGASAPPHLVDDLVQALSGLGAVTQEHREVTTETIRFTLPKEVRTA